MLKPAIRYNRVVTTTVLPIIAAVVGGLMLGLILRVASPVLVISLIIGCFFFAIALKHTELFMLGLIMATSTAIPFEDIPVIARIGPGRIFVTDLILLFPFALIVLRAIIEPDFQLIGTRLDLPLVLFVLIAFIATFLGFSRAIPSQTGIAQIFDSPPLVISLAIPEIRFVVYYLIFFSATNLIRSEKQLTWLITGLNIVALIAALLLILQVALPDVPLLPVGRVESLLTEGTRYSDVTRVAGLPGEGLILIMFAVVVANLLHQQSTRIWDWLLLVPLGAALLFTYNRNFWVGVGLSALLLAYFGDRVGWQRFAFYGWVGALLVGMVVVVSLGAPESKLARIAYAAGDRVVSLVIPDTYTEGNSFQFRVIEAQYAFEAMTRHPMFGVGLGEYYRPWDNRLDWEYFDGRGYIHNGHLWLMVKSGLAGYLCFAWLSIAFVVRGFRNWRMVKQPQFRAVLLGFVTIYLGVAFAALVNPIYMVANWTPLLGLMMGINEVILRFNGVNDGKIGPKRLWHIYSLKQGEGAGETSEN